MSIPPRESSVTGLPGSGVAPPSLPLSPPCGSSLGVRARMAMRPAASGGGLGTSLGSSIGVHLGVLAAAIGVAFTAADPLGLGSSEAELPTVTWDSASLDSASEFEASYVEEREVLPDPFDEEFTPAEPRVLPVDDRAERLAAALAAPLPGLPSLEPLPDFESELTAAAESFGPRIGAVSEVLPTHPEEEPRPVEAAPEAQPEPAAEPAATPAATGATEGARLIESPAPAYPRIAQRMGIEGKVLLRMHVNPRGLVVRTELLRSSGSDRLDDAALEGVATWRFDPARENGLPVEGTYDHEVEFRLR